MAEPGRARGRAGTWPAGAISGRRYASPWLPTVARGGRFLADIVRQWTIAEGGPGRLMPWVPVAFALGIAAYFAAEREPAEWAAGLSAAGGLALSWFTRHRPGFPIVVLCTAAVCGFSVATLRTSLAAHPVLRQPAYGVSIAGFVETREERERSDRVVVRVRQLESARPIAELARVRVAVRKGSAPAVGSFVRFKARLNPPLSPLRPGGYDFARDLYFQQIGAIGFAMGSIKVEPPPVAPELRLRAAQAIDALRDGIDRRIRTAVPGDVGSIASALITGKRDAISAPVNDAMYVSSLAHVLSISGYHMAVVAGVVFFLVRAALALLPSLAIGRPIKKWAAGAALIAAALYLVLSGAEVATRRSFIMTAIVLVGVMADRPALTLRTLAVAALAVMLVTPEAVGHPSFQMSFAATLALIAAYERGIPWFSAAADRSVGARLALWGAREIAMLAGASLVAGLATTPYAAYHFHRLAPYGVLANLLAMPIVSGWVMPAGLIALIALPFGFDGMVWRLMGVGIEWMITVALWVASLPGAVGRVPAFGIAALLLGTLGLLVICLLRTPLRWGGSALIAMGVALALAAPRPDVQIAANGDGVAVRGGDGRLTVLKIGSNTFWVREWLSADGDPRGPTDPRLGDGFACDPAGCIARLADDAVVAVARAPEAFADDCTRAALVIALREAPPGCEAAIIDRAQWRDGGALSLRRSSRGWEITAARPAGLDRPWAPANAVPAERAARPLTSRPALPDATPAADALEADD